MSKQSNLDDVFRNGLKSLKEPYEEGAWLNMQSKLTSDTLKPKFWFSFLNKKSLNIFIAMSLLFFVLTSCFLFLNKPSGIKTLSSTSSTMASTSSKASINNPISLGSSQTSSKIAAISNGSGTQSNSTQNNLAKAKTNKIAARAYSDIENHTLIPELNTEIISAKKQVIVSAITSMKLKFQFNIVNIKNNFIPLALPQNKYPNWHYDCPTFGVHLNYLYPSNKYASYGQKPGMGFDLEGYSGNLTRGKYFGLFLGGSGSIAWAGKSSKTNIILNTSNNDPGVTFLQNMFTDLNIIGRLEFGRGDIKFYATGFAGWHGIYVSQQIQSKKQLDGFENSSTNVWSKSMLQWGGGAGLRYHFAPGVSFDLRGMYQDVDFMQAANVRRSTYNELTGKYNVSYNLLQPQFLSIRLGFLFCLEDMKSSVGSHGRGGNNIEIHSGNTRSGGTPLQIKVPTKPVTPKILR